MNFRFNTLASIALTAGLLASGFSCNVSASADAGADVAAPAKAISPSDRELNTGLSDAEVKAFFEKVKAASAAQDARAMAKLVKFPLRVNGKMSVKSSRRLIARYSNVFNNVVTQAIETQRYETLFSNYQGVMMGDGQVWFNKVCRQKACTSYATRIIAVNNE
jgi:hypothetical protein